MAQNGYKKKVRRLLTKLGFFLTAPPPTPLYLRKGRVIRKRRPMHVRYDKEGDDDEIVRDVGAGAGNWSCLPTSR